MKGRTIQIFLPFGSPGGIKIAEITNRTVQAIYIPRNQLSEAQKRDEVSNVGLYFLFGQSDEDATPQVYIGEAENCYERLKQHNKEKDFWDAAVVVVTNNNQNQFTKTDVKFLENLSFEKANELKRYKLNQTVPTKSFVPEWRTYDLYDIFDTMKILLATLGFPIFDEIRKAKEAKDIFYCKGKGLVSKGEYTEEGFVVFAGSEMAMETYNTIHNYLQTKRAALISGQVVVASGEKYLFEKDYLFPSPSQAAGVVLGRSANGWIEWKNKEGKTLDEMKRKN